MKKTIFLSILLAACCFFAQSQDCAYLAYEPFVGDFNSALQGLQGGFGWGEPWLVQNEDASVPGYHIAPGNLTYDSLQTGGNHLSGGFQYLTAGRPLDISADGPFQSYLRNNGAIGADGTTLWFSVLLRKNQDNDDQVFVELNADQLGWVIQDDRPHLGVGYYGEASNVDGQRRWSLRIGPDIYPSNQPALADETVLAVVRIAFNASDGHIVDVYFNPSLGTAPPESPALSQFFTGDLWIRSVAVLASRTGEGDFDEIRLAESYTCVTPTGDVSVNEPPAAFLSASVTDGSAPLAVVFNGDGSSDPDGDIVLYEWNFGDGSPLFTQTEAAPFTHTYTVEGLLTASLRVTDNDGAIATIEQEIVVRDEDGVFSCQVGATLINPASYEQNDGRIRVNNVWNGLIDAYTLTQENNGAILEPDAEYTFNDLAAGRYTLAAQGSGGCIDTLRLTVPADSRSCSGWAPRKCRTQFGMNLNFPSYWTTERPFKNLFRFNGGFYSTFQETPWIPSEQYEAMPKDAEGYPMQVPWTDDSGVSHVVKVVVSTDGYYPNETLIVLYDGQGDIRSSAPMSNITPGRFEIVVDGPNQILLDLLESQAGDHIRNIRVLRLEDEFADLNANPFHETFLDRLAPFRSIRFMNWMDINHSEMTTWSQRTLPNHYNQGLGNVGGVAYEYLIQLCNRLQSDPWICIPHQADDDYVRQLARLFRDNLDNSLTIYLEYSNEVWNWQFAQAHWVTDNGPTNLSYPRRYAERATRTMRTFTDEFGEQAGRVKRVLGAQLTNNWLTDEILSQADPADYDYISPSAYFGFSGGACEAALDSSSTALDIIECTRQTFYEYYASMEQDYWNAKMYGKEVVNYEAGNHMTNFNPNVPFADALREAQTHPAIYDLYQEVIDSLRILDSRLVMFFVLASRLGNSVDVFGHLDHIDQLAPFNVSAPKYQVLLDNIAEPCIDETTDSCQNLDLLISPIVYLQGPYNLITGLMRDDLRFNALPLEEPYTDLGYTHIGGGGESTQQPVFDLSGPDAIVDWVFLELRDKSNFNLVIATRSALLQSDGDVVDVDGVSPVAFANVSADEYYLVVKHRNHLDAMSVAPIAFSNTTVVVDFTSNINAIFGGLNGIVGMDDGRLALFSGDFNYNGQVQNTDYNNMLSSLGTAGYEPGDFDLNGQVQNTDLQLKLIPNIGRGQPFGQ